MADKDAFESLAAQILRGSVDRVLAEARDPAAFARHGAELDAVVARAREAADSPIPPLPWSLLRLFKDTGNRRLFEKPYFERRRAFSALEVAILAGRDADGSLLAAFHDLLWAICDEYSWSLPAHYGPQRPIPITLDLFASETGLYVAEALHLLGDRLDPRVADRCRAELRRRLLDSYLGDYPGYWWENGTNNWGAVCAGSLGIVFLYEEKDPARLKAALVRVLATMDAFLSSFPPDGTCLEGVGYWQYGFGLFALFADFVHQYTDGAVDLFADPRARRVALFPQGVALTATRTVSFADGSRFKPAVCDAETILRRHYGDAVAPGGSHLDTPGTKPSMFVRSFLWGDGSQRAPTPPDGTVYLPDAQWLVVRKAPFAFAALFGNNGVPHNHNDIGSFLLVDGDGEGPMDLGSGEYTRQYFSAERYTIFCNGSQGHSVPIVGGRFQEAGGQRRAKDVAFEERDGKAFFSADIAGAYGVDGLVSLRRAFEVDPTAGSVELRDDFAFSGGPLAVTERFVGYAEAEITGPGEARFGVFAVSFDPALKASVRTEPMSPHARMQGGDSQLVHILDIEVPAGTTSFVAVFAPKTLAADVASLGNLC